MNTDAYFSAPLRRSTITYSLRVVFLLFLLVDVLGIGVAFYQLAG
jgi:hypothetical protein